MNMENYKQYFTKEYLMGPNSLRLLGEIITDNPQAIQSGNVLDLGCGAALSSILLESSPLLCVNSIRLNVFMLKQHANVSLSQ